MLYIIDSCFQFDPVNKLIITFVKYFLGLKLELAITIMSTEEIFILLSEPEVPLCFSRDITLSGFLSVSIGT